MGKMIPCFLLFLDYIRTCFAISVHWNPEKNDQYATLEHALDFVQINPTNCPSLVSILLDTDLKESESKLENKHYILNCTISISSSPQQNSITLVNSSITFSNGAGVLFENVSLRIQSGVIASEGFLFFSSVILEFSEGIGLGNYLTCKSCTYMQIENAEIKIRNGPLRALPPLIFCYNCSKFLLNRVSFNGFAAVKNVSQRGLLLEKVESISMTEIKLVDVSFSIFSEINSMKQSIYISDFIVQSAELNSLFFVRCEGFSEYRAKVQLRNLILNNVTNNFETPFALLFFQTQSASDLSFLNISVQYVASSYKIIEVLSSIKSTLTLEKVFCSHNKYSNFLFAEGLSEVLLSNLNFFENNNNNSTNDFSESSAGVLLVNVYYSSLTNGTFENNLAQKLNPCVHMYQDEEFGSPTAVNIRNCEFTGNRLSASPSKSARSACLSLYIIGTISISKIVARGNSLLTDELNEYAPCLLSNNHESILFISESYFFNNTSIMSTNCVFVFAKNLYLDGIIFNGNRNFNDSKNDNSFGGALAAAADKGFMNNLSVIGCSATTAAGIGIVMRTDFNFQYYRLSNILFENNSAHTKGGSLFLQHYDAHTWIYMDVFDSDFINNSAEKEGGAAYIQIENTIILFQRCQFISNQGSRGGAVFHACLNKESVYVYCNFSFNRAFSSQEGGGVFYNMDDQTIETMFCVSNGNNAGYRGGFVQLLKGKYFDFGSTFLNNSAGQDGGNIIVHKEVQVIMRKSVIEKGKTNFQGAFILLMQKSNCSLENLTVRGVLSPKGAVITIMQESNLTIENLLVSEASSEIGAFLYSLNTFEIIKIRNLTLINSKSQKTGIFFYVFSYLQISNITLTNCSGGAFHSVDSISYLDSMSMVDHTCDLMNVDEGCLFDIEISSISVTNGKFEHFRLLGKKTLVSVRKQSRINFQRVAVKNITTQGEIVVLKSRRSSTNLEAFELAYAHGKSAFLFEQNSSVNMINVSANLHQSILTSGFLLCSSCLNTSISFSVFKGLQSSDSSLLLFLISPKFSSSKTDLLIRNCRFMENKATHGGVIYILDQRAVVENCNFTANSADFGGIFLFNCTSNTLDHSICSLNVSKSIFSNNSALVAGAVIYSYHLKPNFDPENIFSDNYAPVKNEIYASIPIKLKLSQFPVDPKGSGIPFSRPLIVDLMDEYEQKCDYVGSEAIAAIAVYLSEKVTYTAALLGNKMLRAVNGSFNFSDLTIVATPGTHIHLVLSVNIIPTFSPYLKGMGRAVSDQNPDFTDPENLRTIFDVNSHVNKSGSYSFVFPQIIRKCQSGEIYMRSKNVCHKCIKGLFSFDPEIEQCFDCPDNMICEGGDAVLVEENYWRKSKNSPIAYFCGIFNQGCKGGSVDTQCKTEYNGALCSACLFNETHQYFKNILRNCSDCRDKNLVLPILLMFIFVAFLTFQLFLSIRESFKITSKRVQLTASFLTNLLINYLEMAGIVTNMIDNIPAFIKTIFFYIGVAFDLGNATGITDCFIGDFSHSSSNVSIYELRQLLTNMLILAVFLLPLLLRLLLRLANRGQLFLKANILVIIITLFKLMMQPMIKMFSSNFDCFSIEDKTFLSMNPTLECFQGDHLKTLLIIVGPAMLLIFILPLLLMLVFIIKKRKILKRPDVEEKVWLITLGYRDKYFYWEYILLLFKISLIITPILLNSQAALSLVVLIFIVFMFLLIQLNIRPYISDKLNTLALLQYLALFSFYSTALILTVPIEDYIRLLFLIGTAIVNLVFAVYWTNFFFRTYKEEMKREGTTWNILYGFTKAIQTVSNTLSLRFSFSNSRPRRSANPNSDPTPNRNSGRNRSKIQPVDLNLHT